MLLLGPSDCGVGTAAGAAAASCTRLTVACQVSNIVCNLCWMQVALYPSETSSWLLSSDGADMLAVALQGTNLEGALAPPLALQQHLLSAITGAMGAHPPPSVSADVGQLMTVLQGLSVSSQDAGVASAAAHAAERLSQK